MTIKNKTQLITVFLIIVAAVIFSLWRAGINPFSKTNQWRWQFEKTIIGKEQDTNQNPDVIQTKDGCWRIYSHGSGGTGLHGIYSYRSCDGMNWQFEGKRIDKAAMPAAMLTEDGKTRIYFQRGTQDDKKSALMTAISDDGLNFSKEEELLVTDEEELKGIKSIAHFELVKLDKGYRLYFDEAGLTPKDFEKYKEENWEWGAGRIRSLYSDDGLHWRLEPGIRIDYEQAPLTLMQKAGSCTVIKDGDQYHMFFYAGFSPWEDLKWWKRLSWSGLYEAVSTDGLDWEIIDHNLKRTGSDPKIIDMREGTRMFISEGIHGVDTSNSIETYLKRD